MSQWTSTLFATVISSVATAGNPDSGSFVLDAKLALGGNYALAITEDGRVVSWGSDHLGDLSDITDAVDLAAFWGHALILRADGSVIAVGANSQGEANVPAGLPPITAVATGYQRSWVVDHVGQVHAWGDDYYCGAGSSSLHIPAGLVATELSGGNAHWLFRRSDGTVGGSGCNYNGQLNIPSSLQPVIDFEAAESWTAVIGVDGRIHAYGFNGIGGQLNTPGGTGFIDIACGYYFGVAAREDGSVATWGSNQQGERNIPGGLPATIAVEASAYYAAAVHEDGTVTMWGQNGSGECNPPADLRIRTHDRDCDGDGIPDWRELIEGTAIDTDGDGTIDCMDGCPDDPEKTDPGQCGCGVPESGDMDADGLLDCIDPCPTWPYDCSKDGMTICVSPGQPIALAISKVPDGGTLKLKPGTFNQPIDFVGRAITVEGDVTNPAAVVLDGTGLVDTSVVKMVNGEDPDSILRGVTIRNGSSGTPFNIHMVGGAIHTLESSPTIEDCVFEMNTAGYGGAIYARKGAPTLRRCLFRENLAEFDGGGFQFARTEGGMLVDCVFENNTAGNNGGAVHLFGGVPALVECTMEGNFAGNGGGGVSWASTNEPGAIVTSHITGNEAVHGGGLWIAQDAADLSVTDTVICDNSPSDIAGPIVDGGGNHFCTCNGDYNGDGFVTGADLGTWLQYAGGDCAAGEPCPGDLDGDGFISGSDLGVLLANWGICG